ncbi:hypothetical protein [Blastococcus haudaquaticus]|uniref:Uncharacterized protein n=1 Tax=Blastococcus haudaquaticus TaxID=1938745 RepID=A0A286H1E8_9ACTN|nr:hypothetical protein [Blastococcus haudaquaticus]SOE01542.1 hypothetical protein SAMN06272739_3227 [Blastococcus haudaquaticus]
MTSPSPVGAELTPGEVDALAFQAVVVLGTVPDLAVALVRFARRDRGIQLGPTLATLGVAAAAPRWGRWAIRAAGRRGVIARVGLAAAVLLLPAAAGVVRPTVVGTRNPLWQVAASAAVRTVSGCLTALPVALAVGRRRRDGRLSEG